MIFGEGRYSSALRILACVLLAGLLALALQLLPFSSRRLLIGAGVFTGPELAFLEIAVGAINALIVTLVCLLVLRRPVLWLTMAAVVVQIVGIELAYGFRQGGDTVVESLLRYTEHVGVITGAAVAIWIYRTLTRPRGPVSAAN
jgi:hypothetical protein